MQYRHIVPFVFLFVLLAGSAVQATPIGLFRTGGDLNNDGIDDLFLITRRPDIPGPLVDPAYVVASPESITPATGGHWLNALDVRWVAPAKLRDGDDFPSGIYHYSAFFNLSGMLFSSAVLEGLWGADGVGRDILINGKSTGLKTNNPTPGTMAGSYTQLTGFRITDSSCDGGCFQDGWNTFTFVINNGDHETGMVGQFTVNANAIPGEVPEPATWVTLALGLGLIVAGAVRRSAV